MRYCDSSSSYRFCLIHLQLFHQSNLLHGVRVENGTRWSWIVWIKDTESCADDSLHWTHAQALSGVDPIAQYIHSKRSLLKEKIHWLRESTKLGFPLAANELGLMYSTGNSELEQNLTEAKRLFLLAENVPEAYFNLGMMSLSEKEISQAVEYFKRAVVLGELSKAAQNVGVAYYHGRSVVRNLTAAVEWWERAGNGDSLMKAAQTLLLKDPSLPPVDIPRVLHLFRRSANTGHTPAALYLGRYHDSLGERGEAVHWFMKAARRGDQEAREYLTKLQTQQQQQAADLEEDEEGEQDEEEQDL
jgi:TPR repeat protein